MANLIGLTIFLTRGHTYLPNDRDFAHIELFKRKNTANIMEDYIEIIENARMKSPFTVKVVLSGDIKDHKKLADKTIKSQLKDKNGNNVQISKLMWYSYGASEEMDLATEKITVVSHKDQVWGRYSYNDFEPWVKFTVLKRNANGREEPEIKYPLGHIPLKIENYNDLMKLVDKNIIPAKHHQYYRDLQHVQTRHVRQARGTVDSDDDSDGDDYIYE